MYLLTTGNFPGALEPGFGKGDYCWVSIPHSAWTRYPTSIFTPTSLWGASGHWNLWDQSTLQRGGSEPSVPIGQHSGCVAGRLVLPRAERTHCVHDRCLKTAVPTFWAPGSGFMEDSFSQTGVGMLVSGWFKQHYIYCALYLYYYYISSPQIIRH